MVCFRSDTDSYAASQPYSPEKGSYCQVRMRRFPFSFPWGSFAHCSAAFKQC